MEILCSSTADIHTGIGDEMDRLEILKQEVTEAKKVVGDFVEEDREDYVESLLKGLIQGYDHVLKMIQRLED